MLPELTRIPSLKCVVGIDLSQHIFQAYQKASLLGEVSVEFQLFQVYWEKSGCVAHTAFCPMWTMSLFSEIWVSLLKGTT